MTKSYKEMMKHKTFEGRFKYLKLNGRVSELTFGDNRYLNQMLYRDPEWRRLRRDIIIRDDGCDLAFPDRVIEKGIGRDSYIIVHHINPITVDDVINRSYKVFDPDNVICCTHRTHNAIHYGNEDILECTTFAERFEGDTCLWR